MKTRQTAELIAQIELLVKELVSGANPDWNTLPDCVYKSLADRMLDLSEELESAAESFYIAGTPETVSAIAELARRISVKE